MSSPFCKNISVFPKCKSAYIHLVLSRERGVGHRHERWDGMRWTQMRCRRAAQRRTEKSCGPDVAVLASSLAELSAGRRWQESRSPGRSRRKPLKPLRAGMPGDPGATVVTNARAFYTTRAAADALGIRHSPRPLWGGNDMNNSGASRRGNA